MPGIGLAIREIAFEMFENVDKPKAILHSKTNGRMRSVHSLINQPYYRVTCFIAAPQRPADR